MKARILRWLWAAVGVVAGGPVPKPAPKTKPVAVSRESAYITWRRRVALARIGDDWLLHPKHTAHLKKGP